MLQKSSAADLVEQVRSDPRVRKALRSYRRHAEDGAVLVKLAIAVWSAAMQKATRDLESGARSEAIEAIAQGYQELTRKSPRTADPLSGNRPFDAFVAELFRAEGLDPPGAHRVGKAIKKK
jgi:hypothetical protein